MHFAIARSLSLTVCLCLQNYLALHKCDDCSALRCVRFVSAVKLMSTACE